MHVLSVVGARPQFVKLGAIARSFANTDDVRHTIVHTGQHYDPAMSDVFFRDLLIPTPDVHLGIGSSGHGRQTGAMLAALEPVLEDYRPDWTLVYGDTNSTVAAALCAVKLRVGLAHLEAGLRSFNRSMPEEHNRVVTDHVADLLLAPTDVAMEHLRTEGLGGRATLVGDVMTDICLYYRDRLRDAPLPLDDLDPRASFLVATIHRAENTDDERRLHAILQELKGLPTPVVLVAHPRLVARASTFGLELGGGSLRAVPPLSYPAMIRMIMSARGVITDSGGLQKEAMLLGTPCTTLRSETEWNETLEGGWNVLDPQLAHLRTLADRLPPDTRRAAPFGDGQAAARVTAALRGDHPAH